MSVADDISVLRDGKRITTIPAEEATNNRLAELMVGDEVLLELTATRIRRGGTTPCRRPSDRGDDATRR